jgi:long-chain fatty acid transport protein
MRRWKALGGLAVVLCTAASARRVHAAGLYFEDRGVRPLGRGGAFVAGADDLGAIWYNPAGILDAGSSVLVDASWMHYTSEFARESLVFDGNGTSAAGHLVRFPTVRGSTPFVPLPTLAGSHVFGSHREWAVAVGVFFPYTAFPHYPATVNGVAAPSRYSLPQLEGSALVNAGAFLAYKPTERIRIGGGLHVLAGSFQSSFVFSAVPPDRLVSAAEDPAYDTTSQVNVGPIFTPSANFGITTIPVDAVRIAASVQLPTFVNAPAAVSVRFANSPLFDHATQSGDKAHVRFVFPPVLRMGVEYRTKFAHERELRVEATYVREFWSMHKSVDFRPDNVSLSGIIGFPSPMGVAPITLVRNFQDSNSLRLGGEFFFESGGIPLATRVGANFESSAVPNDYVSPFTIDSSKVALSIGGSLWLMDKKLRLDLVYAHVFAADVSVNPTTAAISGASPVQGNAVKFPEAINGGTYSHRADTLGVGLEYRFGGSAERAKEPSSVPPKQEQPPSRGPDEGDATDGADSE